MKTIKKQVGYRLVITKRNRQIINNFSQFFGRYRSFWLDRRIY
ncbi:hypothetical protein [Sunxiuqinia indica]|nr:hypothetical protein [Sunxiuqinia indica]